MPFERINTGKRLAQLDSLRGLAAFTVLVSHFLLIFPAIGTLVNSTSDQTGNWFLFGITYTPLHIFWAGYEAVIFFFVLSGFVLALPYLNPAKPVSYAGYLTKRIFRIYPPYLCAVIAAVIVNMLFYRGEINGLSAFFNDVGQHPVDWRLVMDHVFFIGSFDNSKFDPVLWSLVHEMRISIVFPIIMYGVRLVDWKINLALGFLLSCFNWWMIHLNFYQEVQYQHDYFATLSYVGFFILGALLAKHRELLVSRFGAMPRPVKYMMLGFAILAYTHRWWLTSSGLLGHGRFYKLLHENFVADWITALGVIIFILAALSSKTASGILAGKVPLFLGKISYSLYLFHAICLIALLDVLYGKIPIWMILIISFAASFVVSTLSYYFVELPAIKTGKFLAGKYFGEGSKR
jgi:peptidoglycan/LPS O-acetylase OafA/YrhL